MQGTVKWAGDLTFIGTSGSGHHMVMDAAKDGAAPSPMEVVLLAAGGCSSVDVVGILRKARQIISGCEVQVSAQRADDIPAVFTTIHLHFVIQGRDVSQSHVERAVRLSAEKYCSVSIMLGASVEVTHSFSVEPEP